MREIIKLIGFISSFITYGVAILIILSIFVEGPLSSIGFIILLILGGLIVVAIFAAIYNKIKCWILFDWLDW